MCFIGGCFLDERVSDLGAVEAALRRLIRAGAARGTDGAGYAIAGTTVRRERLLAGTGALADAFRLDPGARAVLVNARLEPTSEFVREPRPDDLQPYPHPDVTVVHNGIVSNDHALRARYGITLDDTGTSVDSSVLPHLLARFGVLGTDTVTRLAREMEGSYAIAVHDRREPGRLVLACSYKPVWIGVSSRYDAVFFASEEGLLREALQDPDARVERVSPYSGVVLGGGRSREPFPLDFRPSDGPALCVCSGGMDSTTAAAIVRARGQEIVFCHFLYGCKAEARERRAVEAIAGHYGTTAILVPVPWLGELGGSTLTVAEAEIADGDLGVETPHEWVPARNMVLVANAVALCERYGYSRIVLGLNEQEGEVFPDNEMEFLAHLQAAVDIGSIARITMEAPLNRMSKRDIVRTALDLDVPLHLTWSCYRDGERPCGTCGSCLQRRVAFEQLGRTDFIEYGATLPAHPTERAVV